MKLWLLPQASLDVIKLSVTPTASAKMITLDGLTAPFGCVVDWGDGAFSPLMSNTALSHTYADTVLRQIVIRGVLGGLWNTTSSVGKNLVTSLDELVSNSLVTAQNTFRGCTSLLTLPQIFDTPNISNFNYTFYQCRSITSDLPVLWQTNKSASHSGCYTDCFKSFYKQYSTGCPYRQYVSAVPGQTYYQKYGQSGCPAASYYAGTDSISYYEQYGTGCSLCASCSGPSSLINVNKCGLCDSNLIYGPIPGQTLRLCTGHHVGTTYAQIVSHGHTPTCELGDGDGIDHNPLTYPLYLCSSGCEKIYRNGIPSGYDCSYFGGTCKGSSCTRTYQSGQSAYYRCTRSGGTCATSSCPYPYANESSYNTARSNGWA